MITFVIHDCQHLKPNFFAYIIGTKTANYIQFSAQRCPKYTLLKKKASNERCSNFNFVQKSLRGVTD